MPVGSSSCADVDAGAVPRALRRTARLRVAPGLALALCAVIASPLPARAGSFDLFGFGARSIGLGGAGTATADDYTSVFYNPANLVNRKAIHLGAEVLTTIPSLRITLDDPTGETAPIEADSFSGLGLGVLFPLGGKIDYRLAFGLVIYFPTDSLIRIDAVDPLVPRWYVWDTLADKLQILLGVGVELTDWLSLGIGAQSLANIEGRTDFGVDPVNEVFPHRDIRVNIINTAAPIAGLRLGPFGGPFEGLRFGVSWRAALQIAFQLPISLDFGELLDVALIVDGQALYTPHTLSFAAAWDIPDTAWMVSLEGRWWGWSGAPDPALDLDLDIAGELIEALGLGEAIDFVPGPSVFPQLRDTWSVHAGAEVWANEHIVGRAGYSFRQTPVPPQPGVSNYVDNDAHTISVGLGLTHPDPLNLDEHPVTFEVSAAYSLLPSTRTEKESASDPVGSYEHGGSILSLSFSLRHDF